MVADSPPPVGPTAIGNVVTVVVTAVMGHNRLEFVDAFALGFLRLAVVVAFVVVVIGTGNADGPSRVGGEVLVAGDDGEVGEVKDCGESHGGIVFARHARQHVELAAIGVQHQDLRGACDHDLLRLCRRYLVGAVQLDTLDERRKVVVFQCPGHSREAGSDGFLRGLRRSQRFFGFTIG